jgi:hypothetical protein
LRIKKSFLTIPRMSEQNETQNKTEEPKTTKRITTGKGRGRPRKDAANAQKQTNRRMG